MQSPFQRWRRKIWGSIKGPLEKVSPGQRFAIGFALLVIFTTLLIQTPVWQTAGENVYREGDIAREDIISPADIHYVDEAATERERETAKAAIRPIFSFDSRRSDEAVQNFRSAWDKLQRSADSTGDRANVNADSNSAAAWAGPGGAEVGKVLGGPGAEEDRAGVADPGR